MPGYTRIRIEGGTYFFTVCSEARRPILTKKLVRIAIAQATARVRKEYPFEINAWVLLPDHLHCIWTLPPGDADYSKRWSKLKRLVTQARGFSAPHSNWSKASRNEGGLWQRRFWEHCIRSEEDYRLHVDYIHWNPVKHRYVDAVIDWGYSSFTKYVTRGVYDPDWGISESAFERRDFGEQYQRRGSS